MVEKINIELGNVQQTLLLPLWGRAAESRKENPLLIDKAAEEIINKINYDFSIIEKNISYISQIGWVARCIEIDDLIKRFIRKHENATIVNIGCGFDTTFERIDNGRIYWYDLDLPDVIDARERIISKNNRRYYISSSFFGEDWLNKIIIKENILFFAAGVFYYFHEHEIKEFIINLINRFPKCEIIFDGTSNIALANKMVLKKGNMDKESLLKWEIKKVDSIKEWSEKIEEVNQYPIFKNVRKHKGVKNKLILLISDLFKMQFIVQVKMKE
jgi:O-methyltransferase involved in polyketide biosynthesis